MKLVLILNDIRRQQSRSSLTYRDFHHATVEINFWPVHVVYPQRHRPAPRAWLVDHALLIERELFDFSGERTFRRNQKFV